jgi:hypothetical protein
VQYITFWVNPSLRSSYLQQKDQAGTGFFIPTCLHSSGYQKPYFLSPLMVPEIRIVIAVTVVSEMFEISPMADCKSSAPSLLDATMASQLLSSKRIILGWIRARPNSPNNLRTEVIRAISNCSPDSGGSEIVLTRR